MRSIYSIILCLSMLLQSIAIAHAGHLPCAVDGDDPNWSAHITPTVGNWSVGMVLVGGDANCQSELGCHVVTFIVSDESAAAIFMTDAVLVLAPEHQHRSREVTEAWRPPSVG